MDITSDNYKLLELLQQQSQTSVSFLMEKTGMSRKQLAYSIEKINDYLKVSGLEQIVLSKDSVTVPESIRKTDLSILNNGRRYYFENKERLLAVELYLLYRDSGVSLKDLVYLFSISKNTALSDIRKLEEVLEEEKLYVTYSRRNGYSIEGREFIKRNRISSCLERLVQSNNGLIFLRELFAAEGEQIGKINELLSRTEDTLGIHFVEAKTAYLPYLLLIVAKRIAMGRTIENDDFYYNELNDTREFEIINTFIKETYGYPEVENSYLTLLILSTSISRFELVDSSFIREMSKAIEKVIDNFEKNACIVFNEKDKLKNNILQHMIAAYYRIRYRLSLSNEMVDTIRSNANNQEFRNAFRMLETSIGPLAELLETEIPEVEMDFLVLQFIGWMRRQNFDRQEKKRAIVVCLNGVSISMLMFVSLKEIFPEFVFTDVVSLREFNNVDPGNYDLIFSTIPLKTNKKIIVVENVIDLKYKALLRERVFAELYDLDVAVTDLGIVYQTIDSMLEDGQAQELKAGIAAALERNRQLPAGNENDASLKELINGRITIINSVKDYKQAIELAGKTLLEEGIIERRYLDKIIASYDYEYPNILFGEQIAVPHGSHEDGTSGLGMSLLKINEGVRFSDDDLVHIVILLAPIDRKAHLKALLQLAELSVNEEDLNRIIETHDKQEIDETLDRYS